MENLEFIDNYFNGSKTPEQKKAFEQRIINDVSFAKDVAFYISVNGLVQQQVQQEKKDKFWELYEQRKITPIINHPVKKLWRYMAAASVAGLIILLTWYLSGQKTSPQQLAEQYILTNFQTLSVTMGKEDSLQKGLSLYNAGKLTEALQQFEMMLKNDSANSAVKKYAGIVSLRLAQYDKALKYFNLLEVDSNLYSNPGKFYKAITLLKSDKNNNTALAKSLLLQVVDNSLEGKNEAKELLKKL